MQFGLLYDFRNPPPWAVPFPRLYAETLEQIRTVDTLGFDSVWVTEHHQIDDGYLPSVLPAAAAIAAVTQRVRIGTCVLLLPLHHPLRVAEDGAIVDVVSNGRFIFGAGLGYKLDEFAAYGIDRRQRPSRMDESLEIISRAWTEEQFDFHGRRFDLKDVRLTPKPVQRPRPPIWLAGRAEPALRRAVRYGDGVIAVGAPELIQQYRALLAAAGKDPRQATVAVLRSVVLGDDPGRTAEEIAPYVGWRARNYAEWYGEAGDLPADVAWRERARREEGAATGITPAMTVEAAAAEVAALAAIGVDCVIYFATLPGYPPSAMLPTWETFARQIIPRFR
ncbi:MAG TPA: LLM class flavin-dependent oxidoreductase [Dehalococcoidia bacterium]|nr:LLM class flavin-dependent oxidoreductase [Dehalococcoidia bacterium]